MKKIRVIQALSLAAVTISVVAVGSALASTATTKKAEGCKPGTFYVQAPKGSFDNPYGIKGRQNVTVKVPMCAAHGKHLIVMLLPEGQQRFYRVASVPMDTTRKFMKTIYKIGAPNDRIGSEYQIWVMGVSDACNRSIWEAIPDSDGSIDASQRPFGCSDDDVDNAKIIYLKKTRKA